MSARTLRARASTVNAMQLALAYLDDGTLSIDAEGMIWRHYVHDGWGGRSAVTPRRAENPTKKGYLAVTLGVPGTRKTRSVLAHCLIWTRLHGPIPKPLQINHKDLDKTNNRPGNLELMTNAQNIQHSYDNGRPLPWHKATEWRPGKPRISEAEKARVLELRANGLGSHRIRKLTGISKTHIERIFKKGVAR